MIEIKTSGDGLTFWVYVQPRASKKAIVGSHQNALKVKLTAPPVEGAANKQCIELLAKALSLPKSTLEIISGQTSRHKQLLIRAKTGPMNPAEKTALKAKLAELAG